MTARGKDAGALLGLAAETLKAEIMTALPAEKRYAAAMIANALEVAAREIAGEAEAAQFALLDAVYEDGDGTLKRLAGDIRSGAVNDRSHPDLRARLKAQLIAELAVRNPRFLKSRGVKA